MTQVVESHGYSAVNIKEVVEKAKDGMLDKNPALKKASMDNLIAVYKRVGPQVMKVLTKDLAEAQRKTLDGALEKVPAEEMLVETGKTNKQNDDMDELLPREDILPKVTGDVIKMLTGDKWQEKKASLEAIDKLLENSGDRVKADSLRDLTDMVARSAKDKNKVVQK